MKLISLVIVYLFEANLVLKQHLFSTKCEMIYLPEQ